MADITFWYEFASTYSYPAAMAIEAAAAERGLDLAWRPFLLGPIFAAQGWNDSPFNLQPVKGAYMWRDLERITARAGLPFQRPSRFPRGGVLAPRLALVGVAGGWVAPFTRAVYQANFAQDREITDPAVLAAILTGIGIDADPALAEANSPGTKAALKANTEEAIALGLFGAPAFTVGGEVFWGHDRMDQALDWAMAARG